MIFPWRPAPDVAFAVLATKRSEGIAASPLGTALFIPCIGAPDADTALRTPSPAEAASIQSLWLTVERMPDTSAVAIYPEVWFSSKPITRSGSHP